MLKTDRARKHILLVEDHEDALEIVAFNLPEYKLIYARDFNEGLRVSRRRYFDLYILDNWLPDGTGVGLCRLIREFDPHTPILFYSAVATACDMEEALRAGAQAYLIKPVESGEFRLAVAQLTSAVGKRDAEARLAEITAIREELAIQRIENAALMENAKEKHQRSQEKSMRLKAELAFLGAGGTRGDFARQWPSVFIEEARGHSDSERL